MSVVRSITTVFCAAADFAVRIAKNMPASIPSSAMLYTLPSRPSCWRTLVAAVGAATLLACGDSSGPSGGNLDSLTISPSVVILAPGRSKQLKVTGRTAAGAVAPVSGVTFSSSAPSIVSVSANGEVTAVGPLGTAAITAQAAGMTATAEVDVENVTHPEGVVSGTATLGSAAHGLAISRDGVVYLATRDGVFRAELPDTTFTLVMPSRLAEAWDVKLSSDDTRLYVANLHRDSVLLIDVATGNVLAGFRDVGIDGIARTPVALVVSKDGTRVYASVNTGGINVLDAETLARMTGINVGTIFGGDIAFAMNRAGTRLYGSGALFAGVSEIDLTADTLVRFLDDDQLGDPSRQLKGVALSPDGSTLYVANIAASVLDVVDVATNIRQSVPLPRGGALGPYDVAMTPDGTQLYVTNGGLLQILDRETVTIVKTLDLGTNLQHIAFTADGSTALVVDAAGAVFFVK
ncbi:MAG TPA: Ig-like domain-containing protein [Gemmatimonadaceae bacterium]|nr:Ig-like domain-containing protein [Gemmatimonadaceae bacterium]